MAIAFLPRLASAYTLRTRTFINLYNFAFLSSVLFALKRLHVVFVPKKRRSVLYGRIREALGPIFHALARQKECRIVEGHICSDHVHMCIEIPPKYAVSSAIGFIKGKSAIAIARQFKGKDHNFAGEHFWARGYAVSTVGFNEDDVRKYIQDQDPSDGHQGAF